MKYFFTFLSMLCVPIFALATETSSHSETNPVMNGAVIIQKIPVNLLKNRECLVLYRSWIKLIRSPQDQM